MYKLKHQALCLRHQYTGSIYPYIAVPVDHDITYRDLYKKLAKLLTKEPRHEHLPPIVIAELLDDFFMDCDMDDLAFPDMDPFITDDNGDGQILYLNFIPDFNGQSLSGLNSAYNEAIKYNNAMFTYDNIMYMTKYTGHFIRYLEIAA